MSTDTKALREAAAACASAIEADLTDRSGCGWDDIDDETQGQIREAWTTILTGTLHSAVETREKRIAELEAALAAATRGLGRMLDQHDGRAFVSVEMDDGRVVSGPEAAHHEHGIALDALAGGTAALDAIILATRTKAFTEGHAAGMQAAYDGEVTNAALAQARKEGFREGVERAGRACDAYAKDWATRASATPDDDGEAILRRTVVSGAASSLAHRIRALLPDSADAGPVAARYQAEWDAMRANADAPESFADTPPADWRPPWQEHKDIRPPLRSVGDSATGPVAARWAARPVEERKALLADALSGDGDVTQGPPKGGPDAE